jgi:hypothetical protein
MAFATAQASEEQDVTQPLRSAQLAAALGLGPHASNEIVAVNRPQAERLASFLASAPEFRSFTASAWDEPLLLLAERLVNAVANAVQGRDGGSRLSDRQPR